VIHAIVSNNTSIPSIYALMEHKNQDSYERLFDAVEQHAASLTTPSVPDPSLVIIDFEAVVVCAVRQVFGDTTEVHGCFFHLTQIDVAQNPDTGLVDKVLGG